ncbi:MAG: leucine-rich repeat domain-containing protein [Planctomycetes bacterium]|nr:leucine-rich repeat domain-containing protein [Planctomycetota bacterium]
MTDENVRRLQAEWESTRDQAVLERLIHAVRRHGGRLGELLDRRRCPATVFKSRRGYTVSAIVPTALQDVGRGDFWLWAHEVELGSTPRAVEVPECLLWWARPNGGLKSLGKLLDELEQAGVPGLSLTRRHLRDDQLPLLSGRSFRYLALGQTKLTSVAGLPAGLQALDLWRMPHLKLSDALGHAAKLPDLTHLGLAGYDRLTAVELGLVPSSVTHLNLSYCRRLDVDALLGLALRLTELRELHLHYSPWLGSKELRALKAFRGLRFLGLGHCRKVSAETLAQSGLRAALPECVVLGATIN